MHYEQSASIDYHFIPIVANQMEKDAGDKYRTKERKPVYDIYTVKQRTPI